MRTIIFDISGAYGHFRKPYAPASPVSYPFPPPPTVLGIMGAITGMGKDEYHKRLGWDKVRIGIRILNPIHVFRATVNLVNTKADWYYIKSRIQIPYEFLKNPAFRIYIAGLPEDIADLLGSLLVDGKTVYTPGLGLAQCIADVAFVADTKACPAPRAESTFSVIPIGDSTVIEYEAGRRYERVRIATRMDPERTVHEYCQAVTALDANPAKPVTVRGSDLYEVNGEFIPFF